MKNKNRILAVIVISFFVSFLLEIFLFNFRTFESYFYKDTDLTSKIKYHGIKKEGDNYSVVNDKDNYIEIKNINKKVNNIKLDLDTVGNHKYLKYKLSFKDEANSLYFDLNDKYLYTPIKKSKYIRLRLSGKAKSIKISFSKPKYAVFPKDENVAFKINNISVNSKVPMDISYTRLLNLNIISIKLILKINIKKELYVVVLLL